MNNRTQFQWWLLRVEFRKYSSITAYNKNIPIAFPSDVNLTDFLFVWFFPAPCLFCCSGRCRNFSTKWGLQHLGLFTKSRARHQKFLASSKQLHRSSGQTHLEFDESSRVSPVPLRPLRVLPQQLHLAQAFSRRQGSQVLKLRRWWALSDSR